MVNLPNNHRDEIDQASEPDAADDIPRLSDLKGPGSRKLQNFLKVFAENGNISKAADAAGICRQTHYRALSDPIYRALFDDAEERAGDALEAEAWRRAVDGVRKMKFHKGKPIIDPETGKPYTEHEFSDTLMIHLLRARLPDKYAVERHQHSGSLNVNNSRPAIVVIDKSGDSRAAIEQVRAEVPDAGPIICLPDNGRDQLPYPVLAERQRLNGDSQN